LAVVEHRKTGASLGSLFTQLGQPTARLPKSTKTQIPLRGECDAADTQVGSSWQNTARTEGRVQLPRSDNFESQQRGGSSVEAMEFDDQQPWEQLTLAELTELLEELTELDFSESEVDGIRNLALELGSLEEALELIVAQGEQAEESPGREAA